MIINSNMPALKIHQQVTRANRSANTAMERLSTGLRINSSSDDPSGLAMSNRMRREISSIGIVSQNALDGASVLQTADSALNEVHSILQRIRELSVQAGNDTLSDNDKHQIQLEVQELLDEIDNIGQNTTFNNKPLFSGSFKQLDEDDNVVHEHGRFMVRIGQNKDNLMYMNIDRLSTDALNLHDVDVSVENGASDALERISSAIDQVSVMRANIGAYENRLMHTSSVLESTGINMQAGLSRMIDTDMALEMSTLTQQNVISQAGISVMAQANQRPNQILQFLG